MTSKKKQNSGLVPVAIPSFTIPEQAILQYQSKEINITPPYPDVGVEYAGYSKEISSDNKYNLKKQYEAIPIFSGHIQTGPGTTTKVCPKNFIVTGILIQHNNLGTTPGKITISGDSLLTYYSIYDFGMTYTSQKNFFIDMSKCPKCVKNGIITINIDFAIAAPATFSVIVFGFQETI